MLVLAACGGEEAPTVPPPPPEVTVVTVKSENVPEVFEFAGEVVPYRRVEVRARVDGIIERRPFTEGQLVHAGQILYQLERVRRAAELHDAEARLENALRTLHRLEPLLGARAVAQQEVDDARREVEGAQAEFDLAKKDFDDTTVRAEISGRVGRTLLEVGARVTGPADLLTTIDRIDPAHVTFRPSTQQLLDWHHDPHSRALVRPGGGATVQAVLLGGQALPRTGRIDFVAPTLDPETGTQEFRALFQNPDLLLLPGQFVQVRLGGFQRANAIAVPQRAVQSAMGRQFVYVVGPGDTAQARDVDTGSWSGDRWIILDGLRAGDRVIVDGAQKVMPGQPVRPVAPGATSAPARAGTGGVPR